LNLDLSGIELREEREKAARSLEPDGVLLVREADAAAGFPFQVTKWCERIAEAGRGRLRNSLHFRSRGEWVAALEKLGLGVRVAPVSEGTPFANVLFVARRTDRKINPGPPAQRFMKPPLSRYIALAQRRTMVLMSRRGPLLERRIRQTLRVACEKKGVRRAEQFQLGFSEYRPCKRNLPCESELDRQPPQARFLRTAAPDDQLRLCALRARALQSSQRLVKAFVPRQPPDIQEPQRRRRAPSKALSRRRPWQRS
jgi:hypothetical protein